MNYCHSNGYFDLYYHACKRICVAEENKRFQSTLFASCRSTGQLFLPDKTKTYWSGPCFRWKKMTTDESQREKRQNKKATDKKCSSFCSHGPLYDMCDFTIWFLWNVVKSVTIASSNRYRSFSLSFCGVEYDSILRHDFRAHFFGCDKMQF